jgi:hypothetical protein
MILGSLALIKGVAARIARWPLLEPDAGPHPRATRTVKVIPAWLRLGQRTARATLDSPCPVPSGSHPDGADAWTAVSVAQRTPPYFSWPMGKRPSGSSQF